MLLFALFRAGFEPLSWRGESRIFVKNLKVVSVLLGGITTHTAAQNRRRLAWPKNPILGAPSFSAHRSRLPAPFCPHAIRYLLSAIAA
jgi:hypothetical protein